MMSQQVKIVLCVRPSAALKILTSNFSSTYFLVTGGPLPANLFGFSRLQVENKNSACGTLSSSLTSSGFLPSNTCSRPRLADHELDHFRSTIIVFVSMEEEFMFGQSMYVALVKYK